MADTGYFPTINASTGEADYTPIEAVANEYKKGNVKFQAGTRIPVKKEGQSLTVPAEQYDEAIQDGAEPDFDPNGAAKAFVASAARTLSLGGSDYLVRKAAGLGAAIKGIDVDKAEKDARHVFEGLQTDHPWAEGLGAVAGMVSPGGIEGLAGKVAGSVGLLKDAGEAAAAVKAAKGVEEASAAARAAAEVEASSGRFIGSGLHKIMRYVDPYAAVGAAGKAVEGGLEGVSPALGRIAGLGTEGAIIGGLGAVDESEVGDIPLTGEALWRNTAMGGFFGGGLGLVSVGGRRLFTAAGRIADRLSEAAAGGSGKEYMNAERRYGQGGLGHMNWELGRTPAESAHEGLQRIRAHEMSEAANLSGVVREADSSFEGVKARDLMKEATAAMGEAADKYDVLGGDSSKLRTRLIRELHDHLGFREMPAPIDVGVTVPELTVIGQGNTYAWDKTDGAVIANELGKTSLNILPLNSIAGAEESWINNRVQPLIDKMRAGEAVDPIIVTRDGNRFLVEDGAHRLQAAKAAGFSSIPAIVLDELPQHTLNTEALRIRGRSNLRFSNILTSEIESRFAAKRMQAGLPEKEPAFPREMDVKKYANYLARSEGIEGLAVEKVKANATDYKAYVQELQKMHVEALQGGNREQAVAIGRKLLDSKNAYMTDLEKEVTARNARRKQLLSEAKGYLQQQYNVGKEMYESLRGEARREALDAFQKREFQHTHDTRAVKDYNDNLHVSLEKAREFRKKLDDIIPYNRSKDALLNAQVEIKQAMRGALEGRIEAAMDKASQKASAPLLGRYLHSKMRYGMMKDLERMYERSTGAEAKRFGHFTGFGEYGLAYPLVGAAMGHPIAGVGVALGAGALKKYGPSTAGYLMHKAAKFAQLRALQSETKLAISRGVKEIFEGKATDFSRLKVPEMAPHEMRVTAADAMATIHKMGQFKAVEARLAALDPGAVVLHPKTGAALEGVAKNAVKYLALQIPPKAAAILSTGGKPGPDDVSTTEAHNFLHEVRATQDPHAVLDDLSRGQLNLRTVAAAKVAFPAYSKILSATLKMQQQRDKAQFSMLKSGTKSGFYLLTGDPSPSLIPLLQMNAIGVSMATATGKGRGSGGMSHATFGKSDGVLAQSMATMSQAIESAPPGRRGKSGKSGLGL